MAGLLEEIIASYNALPPEGQAEMRKTALSVGDKKWVPQPGPQTLAYFSEADEIYYGGEAGGGKTDLLVGLAVNEHDRSLLARRIGKEGYKLLDRVVDVIGSTVGRNLSNHTFRRGSGIIECTGFEHESDKERAKGVPYDLYGFDEIGDFAESQYRFIKTWNRSDDPNQRCRIVCAGNPPTHAEGLWVIEYWGPWLKPNHPNPAKSGELRWFISDAEGKDKEVSGPGLYQLYNLDGSEKVKSDGTLDKVRARSRTFIRARLADNKYYGDDYAAVLDALPKELREAYRDGRFDLSLKDNPKQVIPTQWILAAIARGKSRPRPPDDVPMCAMGVDCVGGGVDEFVIATRFDDYWPPLIVEPGAKFPEGRGQGAYVISKRRDRALPILDFGGGYAQEPGTILFQNDIKYEAYKGAEKATSRTKDGKLKFKNKRAQTYWAMRDTLDPDQPGGCNAVLPDDSIMISDLTAVTFEVDAGGVDMLSKDEVKKKLGRSPGRGDAVVMSNTGGTKRENIVNGDWTKNKHSNLPTSANMGHAGQRRRR